MPPEPIVPARAPSTGPLAVRRAGVLLHVTSLPGVDGGHGELGPAAYRFVDFLETAGCTVWQVLPLVPTHEGDGSPYNAISAMAGNPDLVSLDLLVKDGLLEPEAVAAVRAGRATRQEAHRAAAATYFARHGEDADTEFTRWCADEAEWLETYVTFVALRESLGHVSWLDWPAALRDKDRAAVAEAVEPLQGRMNDLRFEQWLFARQWQALREYAAGRGVLFFGDLPIFVSLDSADVWAARHIFRLDEEGRPLTVTGVPPDYFSEDGQRWNNPHYDWDAMAADDFAWWRLRIANQRKLFDLVRIDHFRGFQAAWHVPADAPTAREGEWVENPGPDVLAALLDTAGTGTLVAEDLGIITAEVNALRTGAGLPGMKVLHFAFDGNADNAYLPENHEEATVAYTGTHDNDTTMGWWEAQSQEERGEVRRHLLDPSEHMPWALVRLAMASHARLAVVPAQDLLELDASARMNTPGSAEGNWSWQAENGAFTEAVALRMRALVEEYDRLPA
ncbi:4-alpha-glucanotransferase [Nocardioides caldifontis]|uniref:4-alpha-glucanotransferase n=1 Tax=Nocardioides caldifontis TaxID=2588938 RepID=UPI001939DCCC|nr:4-alpha-glucanotransferase [Nocardioides caldifontis]